MQKARRAILLIGVSKTGGGLVSLQAVESGLDEMEDWAVAQGIDDHDICRISDEAGTKKVVLRDLIDWVTKMNNDLQVPQQLIVYFSGHGSMEQEVMFGYYRTPRAIRPRPSAYLQARPGLGTALSIMSFSSRTPAVFPGQYPIRIRDGNSIFPNLTPPSQNKPVDQFLSLLICNEALLECRPGRTPVLSLLKRVLHSLPPFVECTQRWFTSALIYPT